MDPSQPAGRARGRGRGLYAHPPPVHVKDTDLYVNMFLNDKFNFSHGEFQSFHS